MIEIYTRDCIFLQISFLAFGTFANRNKILKMVEWYYKIDLGGRLNVKLIIKTYL